MTEKAKVRETIGAVNITHTGTALYLLGPGGGTFEGEGFKGQFAPTLGGSTMVIYVETEDGKPYQSYEIDVRMAIEVAILHAKTLRPT